MSKHEPKHNVDKIRLLLSLWVTYHAKTTFPGLCFCWHFTFCFSLCGFEVPTISLPLPLSPPCCLSAPLLPSSAPSLHPQGQWPRLIAVSIAHGFPLLLWPDFCSKRACSWVWNILLFPQTTCQTHKEREQMGIFQRDTGETVCFCSIFIFKIWIFYHVLKSDWGFFFSSDAATSFEKKSILTLKKALKKKNSLKHLIFNSKEDWITDVWVYFKSYSYWKMLCLWLLKYTLAFSPCSMYWEGPQPIYLFCAFRSLTWKGTLIHIWHCELAWKENEDVR